MSEFWWISDNSVEWNGPFDTEKKARQSAERTGRELQDDMHITIVKTIGRGQISHRTTVTWSNE